MAHTHTQPHTHIHTRDCHPRDGHSRAGRGGRAGWGSPPAPLAHTALGSGWEGRGLPSSEPESSWRTGGGTPGRKCRGCHRTGRVPPAHSGRTESGGHAGTQPNKLEVGWEGGRGRGEGSEPVGGALDERHFAELHHGRAGLVLHAGHPLQQLLRLALRVPQLLPPLHQLGVALWGREPGQDWGQRGWASPGCQATFSVLMSWHGSKGRASGQQWDG